MLGLGMHPSVEPLENLPREVRHYRPAMDAGQADRLFAGWKDAVRRVL